VDAYHNPRIRPISSTVERFERDPNAVVHLAELESRRADARRERRARRAASLARVGEWSRLAPMIRRAFGGG
jgi:hypothetical protein